MTNYEVTLNLMRYENHFMYIKDFNHIRKSFECRFCTKNCKNMNAIKAYEPYCEKTVRYVLNGGFYNAQENIFNTIFEKYKKSFKIPKRKL